MEKGTDLQKLLTTHEEEHLKLVISYCIKGIEESRDTKQNACRPRQYLEVKRLFSQLVPLLALVPQVLPSSPHLAL